MTETGKPEAGAWLGYALLLAALALSTALYALAVGGPWIFDDFVNLQSLYDDRNQPWSALIDKYLISPSGRLGRPVSMLTFIASAVTSGEYLPAWKWFNIGLHLLTGLALFWMMRRLLQDLGRWSASSAMYGALLIAALWLLHPLHVSTVLYTVQRMAILPVLFSFLGLALYLCGRRRLALGQSGWLPVLAALFLCWPLATFSKENGILLGLYILLLEWLLPSIQAPAVRRKLLALLAVTIVIPGLVAAIYLALNPGYLIGGYALRDFSLLERLLTESRIVWEYVLWIFMPLQRFLGFMHDDISLSTGLLSPVTTLLAVLAWLLVLVAVPVLRKRQPLVAVGVGLFVASQLLESTIIPLELAFEHRNYLGSAGLLLAAVALFAQAIQHPMLRRGLAGLWLGLFVLLLFARVQTWGDINRLYASMWLAHPQSPRMVATVAAQYARTGQPDMGLAVLQTLNNPRLDAVRLYILCLRDDALSDAELDNAYQKAPSLLTDYLLGAFFYTARQGLDGDCRFDAQRFVAVTQRLLSDTNAGADRRYKLLIYRAHFQHRANDLPAALATLEEAAEADATSPIPLSLQTEWLAGAGRYAEASRAYAELEAMLSQPEYIAVDFGERMQELADMLAAASQTD
ncbi:MAG: hypothetical protein ACPHER_00890 [Nevskiales bacterium]